MMRPGRRELIPVWVRTPPRQRPWDDAGGARPSGLSVAGGVLVLLFLTLNAAIAIYRSLSDVGAIVSVALAYLNLVTLFACVAMYVRAPPGPDDDYSLMTRSRLRAAVWMLTMSLTFHYVFEATGTARPTTLNWATLVWAMPAATGVAVFYVFFQVDR